jgi:hypothetical protein
LNLNEVTGSSSVERQLRPGGRFALLAMVSREPFDYQEWRRQYFSQYNVDELLEEVRKHHAGKVS